MEYKEIEFSSHAVMRMFERQIGENEVEAVIVNGEVIREYPDDKPYPSVLLLGWVNQRPIHVVVGKDTETQKIYVITIYEPDATRWQSGFRERR